MTVTTLKRDNTIEVYYCCYCAYNMTKAGYCIDCNEYKSALTFDEYCEIIGTYPIYKGKTA